MNKIRPIVSVIVPVYNVEYYLNRCINSIINQKLSNIEVILVDDGSTDESGRICDEYEKMDHRISVIHKENGGLSSARNAGLNYVLKVYGRAPVEKSDESKYIGPPVKKALIEYQGMDEAEAEEAADLYRRCYVEKFIGESALYDGTLEMLVALKQLRCFLGIATMKTMPQLETLLRNFECEDFFSVLKAARADGSLTKSQMLKDIRDEHPELNMFVMVGDTLGDFQAAERAGYRFVAADYGYGDVRNLKTKHIGHISELLEYHAYLRKK